MRIRIRTKIINSTVLLLFFLLIACDSTVYHSYHHITSDKWDKNDTLFYNVPLNAPGDYQMNIEIRNNNHYSYNNIYLIIRHNIPDTCTFITDTLEYVLTDQNNKWLGTGWGSLYQLSFPYKQFHSNYPAEHTVEITHGMTDSILRNIVDIGIKIEKSQP